MNRGPCLLLLYACFQSDLSLTCNPGETSFEKDVGKAGGSRGAGDGGLAEGPVEAGGGKGGGSRRPYAWVDPAGGPEVWGS